MNGAANSLTVYFSDAYAGRRSAPSAPVVRTMVERVARRERALVQTDELDDVIQDVMARLWQAGRLRQVAFATDAEAMAYVRLSVVNRVRSKRRAERARPVLQSVDEEVAGADGLGEEAERAAAMDADLRERLVSWRPDARLEAQQRSQQLVLVVALFARLTPVVASSRRSPMNQTILAVSPLLLPLRLREITVDDCLRDVYGDALFEDARELKLARARLHTTHSRVRTAWQEWVHDALSTSSTGGVSREELTLLMRLVENLNQRDAGEQEHDG